MSEPMTSTEIEDVLSSIRRLVSDDIRPGQRAAVPAAAGDKLILTPALRVVQAEVEPAAAPVAVPVTAKLAPAATAQTTVVLPLTEAPPMFVAVPRAQLLDAAARDLGGVVASVGAAVDAAPDEWEAEIGDTAPLSAEAAGNPWSVSLEDEAGFVEVSDFAFAEEDLAGELLDQPESDAPHHDHFEYHAATHTAETPIDIPAWAQQDGLDDAEEPVQALHGTVEPDPVWADAAEASVIAELAEPDPAAAGYTSEEDAFDLGMRFDEDVLRELVRDMLREELAGKMGERITRNIRKLVRAEIARALASQEFE